MRFGKIYKQGDDFFVRWSQIAVDDFIPHLKMLDESIIRAEKGVKQTFPLIHVKNKENSFFEAVIYKIFDSKYLLDFSHEKVRDHNLKSNCHEGYWIISYQKKNPFECIWYSEKVMNY